MEHQPAVVVNVQLPHHHERVQLHRVRLCGDPNPSPNPSPSPNPNPNPNPRPNLNPNPRPNPKPKLKPNLNPYQVHLRRPAPTAARLPTGETAAADHAPRA